ncbi:tetratricopeptide repeat protein [Marispirochaeta aestuarii]|uniref:tetratricopeptide repeat protein n=1 Tax=Marispirochaeta aestuarii TaxID=1963862 RepID=UPI0029C83DD5|nr:tetratricopeptide repeat protein [Marispirochaeta aestuarii]
MLNWLRKKQQHDPDDLVEERWKTSFSRLSRRRFPPREEGRGYEASQEKGALQLQLTRKNVFAWVTDPLYRYRDLYLEADIRIPDGNGYCAAGFLLRYIEDGGYYYFLVSNHGYFRFDLVFNDSPMTLIPWTPAPLPEKGLLRLGLIARDDSFVFAINGEWVGEFSDDNLHSGRIAFGGQNYGESDRARFLLEKLDLNSIPIEVEAAYYRWARVQDPPRLRRIALAESLHGIGHFAAALVQLRRAFSQGAPGRDEYFLFAECCLQLGLFPEALTAIEECLKIDPDYLQAVREKANLLYMENRFLELKDYLRRKVEKFPDDEMIWNLLGHGEFGVGNWENAANAYTRACGINSEIPLLFVNAARARERMGDSSTALSDYMTAAGLYFAEEAYFDLEGILPVIRELAGDSPALRALEAKVLFGREDYEKAGEIFEALIREGYEESSVLFLHGTLLAMKGRRHEAVDFLLQAAQAEPDYYLYWLKLADNLHALGLDALEEAEKARSLAPDNQWALNLTGLLRAQKGDLSGARELLSAALAAGPEEEEIQANMAYLVSREEGPDAGIAYLDSLGAWAGESHALLNQRANLLVSRGDLDGAVRLYEKVIRMAPENRDYRMNCAAACLKVDMISRAEELYQEVLEEAEDPAAMTGIGNCAWMKSEFLRAETAYTEAIRIQPGISEAHENLIELLITRRKFPEAEEAITAAEKALPETGRRFLLLKQRFQDAAYDSYCCASCGREWREAKSSDPVPPVRLHGEPPPDAPAGKCEQCGRVYCVSCASQRLENSRFVCECGGYLKLNDPALRRIILRKIGES